jgi:hypothetical protein
MAEWSNDMSFSFRFRFLLPPQIGLDIDSDNWIIDKDGPVIMYSCDSDKRIREAKNISIIGHGYLTEQDAYDSGEHYRDLIRIVFANLRVGVDFGYLSSKSVFYESGLHMLAQKYGRRILNDTHELIAYESDPPPAFASMNLSIRVGRPLEKIERQLGSLLQKHVSISEKERLSFDLFSYSFFEKSADSRFLMLMMAIEILISQNPRSELIKLLVDHLIDDVQKSEIPQNEKDSMEGSLNWLYFESIGQAGRRLVSCLGDRTYFDKTPMAFFTHCYSIRSNLVHGNDDRPPKDVISNLAVFLENFVGDLLSYRFLDLEKS